MKVNDYQEKAMYYLNDKIKQEDLLLNSAMGLCGEAGEVIDLIKKEKFHGHELDKNELIKELGDVAWYLAQAATALDIDLEDILQVNLNKLALRYPNGFSEKNSRNRE